MSARFIEWMMGLPAGWVTDLDLPRTAQIRALGNGVIPQQAKHALQHLHRITAQAPLTTNLDPPSRSRPR